MRCVRQVLLMLLLRHLHKGLLMYAMDRVCDGTCSPDSSYRHSESRWRAHSCICFGAKMTLSVIDMTTFPLKGVEIHVHALRQHCFGTLATLRLSCSTNGKFIHCSPTPHIVGKFCSDRCSRASHSIAAMADDLSFDFEPGLERTQLLTHKETVGAPRVALGPMQRGARM